MSLTDKIVQLIVRAKDEVSKPATDAGAALEQLDDKGRELAKQLRTLEDQQRLVQAFQAQEKATRRAAEANEKARAEVSRLAAAYDAAETPSKELTLELQRAQRAASQSATAYARQEARLNAMGDALDAAALDSKDLAAAQSRIGTEIDATSKALQDNAKQSQKARAGLKEMGDSAAGIGSKIKGLAIGLASFLGITAGLDAVKRGLQSILSTGDQFERLEKQLTAVMGSIEGGEQATAWIKEFAKTTPLQLEEVTQIFTKLKAFGIDPMNGSMQAVVDQAFKLGGSFETVEGISLALGQAWAKQKLQGEEILQLVERGVPVWDLLAKATGKSTLELQKLSSAGKLGRTEIQLLMDEIAASSQGAAAEQMGTLSGLVSNLGDLWTNFLNTIANSGALDYFKQQLASVIAEMERMAASGELQAMARRISDGIVTAAQAVKGFITTLWDMRGVIQAVAVTAAGIKLVKIFEGIPGAARTAKAAMLEFAGATAAGAAGAGRLATAVKGGLLVAVGAALHQITQLPGALYGWIVSSDAAAEASERNARQMDATRKALAEVNAQLGLNLSSLSELYDMEEQGLVVQNMATGAWERVTAAKLADAEAAQRATDVAKAQQEAVESLTRAYGNAITEGKSAAEAVAAVFEAANFNSTTGIIDLQKLLAELSASSTTAADGIRTGIRKQLQELTDGDLRAFSIAAAVSMGEFSGAVDAAALANAEAFRRLGVDIDLASNKISETGNAALGTFELIASNAENSGEKIRLAFDGALAQLRNSTEVDALRAQVVALGEQGRLTGDQLAQMLAELDRRSTEVIPGIQSVEEAFKALGITSERELKRAAAAAKEAFDVIKAEGSLKDQRAAFEAYARAAIAANDGVADSSLEVQAAALGVSDRLAELGSTGQSATTQLQGLPEVIGAIKAASDETQAALADVRGSIEQVVANTDSGAKEVGNALYGLSERAQAAAASLSDATERLYLSLAQGKAGTTELKSESDRLRDSIAELSYGISELDKNMATMQDASGLSAWMFDLRAASNKAQIAYYEQRLEIERLIYTMEQAGGATAGWVAEAERTVERMDLLNESDLSGITGQINQAKQAMESLRNSAESTLTSLREELAQLQGNYAEAEKIRQAQRRTELESQLATAKAYGDREAIAQLTEALKLLDQVSKIQIAEAQQRSQEKATQKTTTTTSSSGRKATLELQLPGGPVQLDTTDESLELLTRRLATLDSVSAG